MDPNQINEWNSQYQVTSLMEKGNKVKASAKDNDLLEEDEKGYENLPPSIRSLLNDKGEVQIGDKIIWYHQGIRYYVEAGDEKGLKDLKSNPGSGKIYGKYSLYQPKNISKKQNGLIQISPMNLTDISVFHYPWDARYQLETNMPLYGNVKYVYELWSYNEWTDYIGYNPDFYTYWTTLYLRMKIETWNGSWGFGHPLPFIRDPYHWRNTRFNINVTQLRLWNISTIDIPAPRTIDFSVPLNYFNDNLPEVQTIYGTDYWQEIKSYGGVQCYCGYGDPVWQTEIYGYIKQRGNASAIYEVNNTPLW